MVLGFAAVNTGNNLIYLVASALLGFMAISGVLGKWNLSKLKLTCTPPEEVYDNLPTMISVKLENHRRWLPVFLLEVVLDERAVLFPLVEPRKVRSKALEVTLNGRGLRSLPKASIRSRFPINFFVRSIVVPVETSVMVFPRPLPYHELQQANDGGTKGSMSSWQKGQEGDITRIGNYVGGEPLKMIHWKLSARHDQLKVKELSASAQTPVTVDLESIRAVNVEQRVSFGTHLVTRLLQSGRPVGLKAGSVEIPPDCSRQHKLLLLKVLALYGKN